MGEHVNRSSGAAGAEGIGWRGWGREPFEESRRSRKPILLSISATWCHWCHVMDRTTFSDPSIIELVNEAFVPVRVDTDVRPDVNARYNMGGWPTVALLDHDGRALSGATYVPPEQMLRWLQKASANYPGLDHEVHARERSQAYSGTTAEPGEAEGYTPSWDTYLDIVGAVSASYDPRYGGFGNAPKFPMFDGLNLALREYLARGDDVFREIVSHTLSAMTGGGTYDHVEGGLFRYSTTRDWRVPHFEKMLLDNALLLFTLAQAHEVLPEQAFEDEARSTAAYMNTVLFTDGLGGWAGSQDADEEYYSLPREARARRAAPSVDRKLYVDWNARAASSMITAGRVFGETAWTERGLHTLRTIFARCSDPVRGLAHYYDGEPHLYGLAHDVISVGAACLDAFSATDNPRWLERSCRLAEGLISTHSASAHIEGATGIVTRVPAPGDPPAFAAPACDFHENAYAAIWLARLSQASDGASVRANAREWARRCMGFCDGQYEEYGVHAAAYGLALDCYLRPTGVPEGVVCDEGVCTVVHTPSESSTQ